jgi:ParB family chromosome partitioning protein
MGHARALLALAAAAQVGAAARVVAQGLSVRETERLAHTLAGASRRRARKAPPRVDPDVARLQESLAERLGASVTIEPRRGGSGRVVIRYASLDQLDGIIAKIG